MRLTHTLLILGAMIVSARTAFGADAAAAVPAKPEGTYDYVRDGSDKFRMFFLERGQLQLIIVGDSRADEGLDPRKFYGDEKVGYARGFNFAIGSTGFDVETVVLDDYISHAPNLKWVVFQISARLFNKYYQDTGIDQLQHSSGYTYDQAHKKEVWEVMPTKILRTDDLLPDLVTYRGRRFVQDMQVFCNLLLQNAQKRNAAGRIWRLMPHETRGQIRRVAESSGMAGMGGRGGRGNRRDYMGLMRAMSNLIGMRHFYYAPEMNGVPLMRLAWRMRGKGLARMSSADMRIFNRLVLEAAFPHQIASSQQPTRLWGWHEPHMRQMTTGDEKDYLATTMEGRFELQPERWQRFERLLDDLAKRNVRVLGYVSPMSTIVAKSPCADDDGTLDSAYWAEMQSLKELQQKHPNFYFYDMHKDGRNDYVTTDYINCDHLNSIGGAKLTARVVAIWKALDAQPKWDVTPPEVASVTSVGDATHVTIVFDEPVKSAEATSPASYAIDRGVTVTQSTLGDDQRTVTLTTSSLSQGPGYTLTVRGVKDRMDNAILSKPVRFHFAKSFSVGDTTPATCVWDKLEVGKPAYVDLPAVWAKVPASFAEASVLRTASADKGAAGDAYLSFTANYPVRVYVAHDENVIMKPSWLDGWTYTWDFLEMDKDKAAKAIPGSDRPYAGPPDPVQARAAARAGIQYKPPTTDRLRLAYKDFPAGKVRLGGNGGPDGRMYVVLVQPLGTVGLPTPPGEQAK